MTSLGHDICDIGINNQLVMGKKLNSKSRNNTFGRGFDMTSPLGIKHNKMNEPPHNLGLPDMEAEFNNVDNKIVCEEPKLSKEDPQETRHLKELLLLHLDWIQQQQEALLAKDRQIQRLKQDKDALKCRLERMDRRMALLRHKNEPSPQRQSNEHVYQEKAKTAPPAPSGARSLPGARGDCHGRGSKRKNSLEPRSLHRKFDAVADSNIETANKSTSTESSDTATPKKSKLSASVRTSTKWDSPLKQSHLYSQQPPRKCRSQSFVDSLGDDTETENETRRVDDSDTDDEVQIMVHGSRKRERSLPPAKSIKDEGLHATDTMYYVPVEINLSPSQISPVKENMEDVKVPTFRIKHVPTGYQLEGTENLTDEIFLKRHQKPEADEKRRKRWDAQMLREQKMLERLQKRQVVATSSTSKNGTVNTHRPDINTFLPDPDHAKYLEICEDIPVSAFGYTVPKLEESEFSLPWYDMEKRARDERGRLSLGYGRRK